MGYFLVKIRANCVGSRVSKIWAWGWVLSAGISNFPSSSVDGSPLYEPGRFTQVLAGWHYFNYVLSGFRGAGVSGPGCGEVGVWLLWLAAVSQPGRGDRL